jgi:ketosteroid isomerase-like protein
MKPFIYLLLVTFLFSCKNKKNDNDKAKEYTEAARKELVQLNQRYDSALVNSDTTRLNEIYAPEFTYTTPEGQVRNKKEQLDNLVSGGLNLEFGQSDEVEVALYDSTAIVTGRFLGKGIYKENIIDIKERYTTVWVKKNGQWKLVKEQGTFIR